MKLEGGCYCGQLRFKAEGDPLLKAQCPLPRMPIFQRRLAQHVRADATTPGAVGGSVLKVGTFDDPTLFGSPKIAIYTVDKQTYHHIPRVCQPLNGYRRGRPKKTNLRRPCERNAYAGTHTPRRLVLRTLLVIGT